MRTILNFKKIGDDSIGYLSFFESKKDIGFEIKRIYYTYDVPLNTKRGMHAHKKLDQLLWCPYGKIEVVLDNGVQTESVLLDTPEKGLLITKGVWRDMYWRKEGSVLCVAGSEYYDQDDYIRNYDDFIEYVKRGYWSNES